MRVNSRQRLLKRRKVALAAREKNLTKWTSEKNSDKIALTEAEIKVLKERVGSK